MADTEDKKKKKNNNTGGMPKERPHRNEASNEGT